MLNAGLRASEALNVRVRDVDWVSGQLMVRQGKGKKDRAVWLNDTDLELLRAWKARRPVAGERLFTTLKGTPINDRDLREMVKRRARKAGISKDVHPHLLRHTFATDLYRATTDIRLVQKTLGHADVSTTMLYTHLVDEAVAHAMRTLRRGEPKSDVPAASGSARPRSRASSSLQAEMAPAG
jgi:integrase/recombinase XerD